MNTLLLRSTQENETSRDKYQEAFQVADVDCVSLSPIAFEFIHLDRLYTHISHPEEYSGLIFSSPRTVQSVALCLQRHDKTDDWNSRLKDEWSNLPAFSVGTSTGGEIKKLGLHPMGEDSGNAENLCKIILEAVKPGSKPLLYPCGTMRRETIPKTLQKEGCSILHCFLQSIRGEVFQRTASQVQNKPTQYTAFGYRWDYTSRNGGAWVFDSWCCREAQPYSTASSHTSMSERN